MSKTKKNDSGVLKFGGASLVGSYIPPKTDVHTKTKVPGCGLVLKNITYRARVEKEDAKGNKGSTVRDKSLSGKRA